MAGRVKWLVDSEHPTGYAVPLTAAEEAQLDADQTAWGAQAAADQATAQTVSTIAANLNARMAKIRQARSALTNGNIFGGLTANEKATLDGLLEDDLYLARLALHLYDAVA